MMKLQRQVTMLHTQQQYQVEKVEELQVEGKKFTGILQFVHQKVCKEEPFIEKVLLQHIISNLVDQM